MISLRFKNEIYINSGIFCYRVVQLNNCSKHVSCLGRGITNNCSKGTVVNGACDQCSTRG